MFKYFFFIITCFYYSDSSFFAVLKNAKLELPKSKKWFILPVTYNSISSFTFNGKAIFKLSEKSSVLAVYSGTVESVGDDFVIISSTIDGFFLTIYYYGLSSMHLKINDKVNAGDVIAVCDQQLVLIVKLDDLILNFFDYLI